MGQPAKESVTDLLQGLRSGDPSAMDRLIPIVYDELRLIAERYLAQDRGTPTLQPTSLVHEAYLKLVDSRSPWQNRAHFFGTAAILMRRLIVDHARRQASLKRGANQLVALTPNVDAATEPPADVIRLNDALDALAANDPRAARIVELKFFGGLSNDEAAEVLGISPATVKRDWAVARAWLQAELSE